MKRWDGRPIEVRNLFNPAFCGVVLFKALRAYDRIDNRGMPFSLALLVLALSLHKISRARLLESTRAHFLKVIASEPQLLIGFADRARAMLPYTQEGLGLLLHVGAISVASDGRIITAPRKMRQWDATTTETRDCQQVAEYLGRQFARVADRATLYTSLGVRP
jgi:hypothetical protein